MSREAAATISIFRARKTSRIDRAQFRARCTGEIPLLASTCRSVTFDIARRRHASPAQTPPCAFRISEAPTRPLTGGNTKLRSCLRTHHQRHSGSAASEATHPRRRDSTAASPASSDVAMQQVRCLRRRAVVRDRSPTAASVTRRRARPRSMRSRVNTRSTPARSRARQRRHEAKFVFLDRKQRCGADREP